MRYRKVCDYCDEYFSSDKDVDTCPDCEKEIRSKEIKSRQKLYRTLADDQKILQYIQLHRNSRRVDVLKALNITDTQWRKFVKRQENKLEVVDNKWSIKIIKPKTECTHAITIPLVRNLEGKIDEDKSVVEFWKELMGQVKKEKTQ